MRQLLFLAALIPPLDGCTPPLLDPMDGAVADSGAPKPKPPPPPPVIIPPLDAGTGTGEVQFEKVTTLAMRPRSIWSLDGQAVWAVGDDNAVFRYDALGWKKLDLPGSAGIQWREVRGDRATIWIVGERGPGEGSFLYSSRLNVIRPMPIEAPRFVFADEREGLWIAGSDGPFGALVNTRDNGMTWQIAALPDGPPIVAGWLDPYMSGTNPPSHLPSPILFRSSGMVVGESTSDGETWEWRDSWDATDRDLTGPVFLWRDDDLVRTGLLMSARCLLEWKKFAEQAQPVLIEDFVPAALWTFSRDDVWSAGGDQVVWKDPAGAWRSLRIPGEDFVAVHAASAKDVWIVARDGDVFHRVP